MFARDFGIFANSSNRIFFDQTISNTNSKNSDFGIFIQTENSVKEEWNNQVKISSDCSVLTYIILTKSKLPYPICYTIASAITYKNMMEQTTCIILDD